MRRKNAMELKPVELAMMASSAGLDDFHVLGQVRAEERAQDDAQG